MKVSSEQQAMYLNEHHQQQDQQRSMSSSPGIIINEKEVFERKMSQEHQHMEDGHEDHFAGHIHHQDNLMSHHHHLHRMEFNRSGSDSHGSQSSGSQSSSSSLEYQHQERSIHERSLDGHSRVSDIAYPMMNLEEFIHQQTAGFSDPDSGSDRSGHSEYGRDYETKGGVIHHKSKASGHLATDFSPSDIALATSPNSQYHFDPSNATFNSDELKPQPIISKSRKTLVPEGMKDNRYVAQPFHVMSLFRKFFTKEQFLI